MNSGVALAQVLCSLFLALLFLQSAAGKLLDWTAARAEVAAALSKTWLRWGPGFLLGVILLGELLAGGMLAGGLFSRPFAGGHATGLEQGGAFVGGLVLMALAYGQRLAKDWAGASSLALYFALDVLALLVLGVD